MSLRESFILCMATTGKSKAGIVACFGVIANELSKER